MKPAWSFTCTAFLPQVVGERRSPSAIVSSLVVIARTTSTSAIIGAGLKKWTPHTWSGRPVSIAISTTGSVDVLVARIVCVGADAVELGEEVLLGGEVLDDRLEHEVAVGELAEVGDRAHPAEHRVALGGVELAPLDLLGERLLEAGDHRVGGALRPAAQHDLDAGLGRDLGDARAHDPRTDDADALDRHHPRSC